MRWKNRILLLCLSLNWSLLIPNCLIPHGPSNESIVKYNEKTLMTKFSLPQTPWRWEVWDDAFLNLISCPSHASLVASVVVGLYWPHGEERLDLVLKTVVLRRRTAVEGNWRAAVNSSALTSLCGMPVLSCIRSKGHRKHSGRFTCFIGLVKRKKYLNYKITALTIQEHVDTPIDFGHDFVPYGAETELIPWCKTIDFIEPETREEVGDGNVFS